MNPVRFVILSISILLLSYSAPVSASNYAFACEQKTLNIQCADGLIHVIRENYGRLSKDLCTDQVHPSNLLDLACKSSNTKAIVANNCSNKQSCSIYASNSVFGDPCVNTFKYLEVEYECISKASVVKHGLACEGYTLDIECEPGHVINLLHVTYGRSNTAVCNCDGSKPVSDTHCSSSSSYSVVDFNCSNKQSCSILAANSVFGDPCYGTYKYLEVDYICKKQTKLCN